MCVTLWQDFIGSTFLSFLSSAPANTANTNANSGSDGEEGGWTLDLHSVAASSKPSPYLPVCVVATRASEGRELEVIGQAQSGNVAGGEVEGARVAAWCDRTGRPLAPGTEPSVLRGEQEVGSSGVGREGRGGPAGVAFFARNVLSSAWRCVPSFGAMRLPIFRLLVHPSFALCVCAGV